MDTDLPEEVKDLVIHAKNVVIAGLYTAGVYSLFAMVCTLAVVLMSVKRGTWVDMKMQIKVSLLLYLVCLPCFVFYFFYVPMQDARLVSRLAVLGLDMIINTWICLHWLFSSMYLQTASLFRATFQTQNDEEFEKLKKRRDSLQCIQTTGLCIVFVFVIFYAIDYYVEHREYTKMITIGLGFLVPWPMTMCIMSLRSASHISMQSKSI